MHELAEIDRAFLESQNLKFIDYIGRGAYGSIFLVYSVQYNQNFALKKVPTKKFRQSEVDCMRVIDNPLIVPLYNYYYFSEYVYLLMEYCPSSLDRELKRTGPLIGKQLLQTTLSILNAIKCCHDNKVAHGDIKPSNFLIDVYNRLKVCDFGLSSVIQHDSLCKLFGGSLAFIAPEVLLKKPYDPFKADIWSVGVTLFFLATNHFPWKIDSEQTVTECITSGCADYSRVPEREYAILISKCIKLDPMQRPSIDELLESPMFAEFHSRRKVFLKPSKGSMQTQSLIKLSRLIVKPISRSTPANQRVLIVSSKSQHITFSPHINEQPR